MRHANGQLSFSATDLSRHLGCHHLTSLRRGVAFGELEPPPSYDDPRAEVLRQRGVEHEQGLLDQLTTDGRTVETIIPPDTPFPHRDPVAVAARTRAAMRRGADVVYQGRLEDAGGRWGGYPDFLLRVDRPSALGGWSYEVLDAKLARRAKGEALLQLLHVLGPAGTGAGHRARADASGARRGRQRELGELPGRGVRGVLPRRSPTVRGARGLAAGHLPGAARTLRRL